MQQGKAKMNVLLTIEDQEHATPDLNVGNTKQTKFPGSLPNNGADSIMIEVVTTSPTCKDAGPRGKNPHASIGHPAITNVTNETETNTRRTNILAIEKNTKNSSSVLGALVEIRRPSLHTTIQSLSDKRVRFARGPPSIKS